jgi:hypothetical protein
MAKPIGPKKVHRGSNEFKVTEGAGLQPSPLALRH